MTVALPSCVTKIEGPDNRGYYSLVLYGADYTKAIIHKFSSPRNKPIIQIMGEGIAKEINERVNSFSEYL